MTKTGKAEPSWAREADEEWAAVVELRLVLDHDAPAGLADTVLAEAHEVVTEAGLPAEEVLGAPEAYARAVARERISEERRARVDAHGLLPGERVTASLAVLGGVGLILSVVRWFENGLWADVSGEGIAFFLTVVGVVVLGTLAFVARATGRTRASWGLLAGAVAAVGAGAAVATLVPDERLFSVPRPVLALGCVAWMWGAVAFPDAVLDRWFAPAPVEGDDARWLDRLGGLLRGRHAMRAAEARGHVREARQHLAASGERAADAFGDVEVYALRLAEGPAREGRLARRKLYGATALGALFAATVLVDDVRDPDPASFWFWLHCAAGAYWVGYVVRGWWRLLAPGPRRPETD
ncbi:hypothetical protein ACQB60_11430 [Actinomycetota bacterium Odt1-20B]